MYLCKNGGYLGCNSQNAFQDIKQGSPWSDSFFIGLIWVCPICLGLFGRQLAIKILEHLQYHAKSGYNCFTQSIPTDLLASERSVDHMWGGGGGGSLDPPGKSQKYRVS